MFSFRTVRSKLGAAILARIIFVCIFGMLPASGRTNTPPKSIPILNHAYCGFADLAGVKDGIRIAIDMSSRNTCREVPDQNYILGSSYRGNLESFIREKYRGRSIEAIVTAGPKTLRFELELRAKDQAKTAVFSAADPKKLDQLSSLPAALNGRTADLPLASRATAAAALVPSLKRMALVGEPLELKAFENGPSSRFRKSRA